MVGTSDIKAAMRQRYTQPEYALAFEVADATGGRASRRADAVVMCMWPSRGLAIMGFEIKVHRSDWLRELKQPAKAENVWRYCDEWTLITAPGVAKAEEIPSGWGWTVYDGKAFKKMVEPVRRPADPPTKDFIAALLRSSGKPDQDELSALVAQKRAEIYAEYDARVIRDVESTVTRRLRDVEKNAEKFAVLEAMLPEGSYVGNDEFALAVRLVIETGAASVYSGLRSIEKSLVTASSRIGDACTKLGVPSLEELDTRHAEALRAHQKPLKAVG